MIATSDITGLVLSGGRGSRMGGIDKGLQPYRGMPLALHSLRRLAPQVGRAMLNANRNLDVYERFGVPVWPDADADGYAGPLAGFLAGLERCETPYLVTVPCDTPDFPADLVERLAEALDAENAELAIARTPESGDAGARPGPQDQPAFCLLRVELQDSLRRFVQDGGSKIGRWTAAQRCAHADFGDAAAFFNANTLDELRQLESRDA